MISRSDIRRRLTIIVNPWLNSRGAELLNLRPLPLDLRPVGSYSPCDLRVVLDKPVENPLRLFLFLRRLRAKHAPQVAQLLLFFVGKQFGYLFHLGVWRLALWFLARSRGAPRWII